MALDLLRPAVAAPRRGRGPLPERPTAPGGAPPPGTRQTFGERMRLPRTVSLLVRVALLALVGGRALGTGTLLDALPWIVALTALVALGLRVDPARHPLLVPLLESAVCCAGIVDTGGTGSALVAYLPAPAYAAGLAGGIRAATIVAGLDSASLLTGWGYAGSRLGDLGDYAATAQHWVGLALVLGLLGAWARNLSPGDDADVRFVEAHLLLDRLRAVTRELPGSLDPTSTAEHVLDRCVAVAPAATRGAVLLVTDEAAQLVPLAVRGARRVPWRTPLTEPGPLGEAHRERRPVLDVRPTDTGTPGWGSRGGRRAESALLVLPMLLGDRSVGLTVLESRDLRAFDRVVPELQRIVTEAALHLDTGLLFDEVRSWASLQERARLAKDMHDGVAQDLAYVGFELDLLRQQLVDQAPALAPDAARLRSQLTDMVADLRLSITDLRSGTGQERGLGAALTSYARSVASARGIAVHLTLDENAFRLPGEAEVQLFKVAREAIGAARRDRTVGNLWLSLVADPPSALLRVEHDGQVDPDHPGRGIDLKVVAEHVDRLGGDLVLAARPGGGLRLDVVLGGGAP